MQPLIQAFARIVVLVSVSVTMAVIIAVGVSKQRRFSVLGMLRRCNRSLDFGNCNRWQEPTEQEEQRHEHTKASEEHQTVEHRRTEITPRSRKEVPTQGSHGDHESFEPHTDVHEDRDDPHRYQVPAEPFEPE